MKMFMVKTLVIASLMSISVLAGMQMANDGIHKIKGNGLQNGVSINEKGNKISTSLGNNGINYDLVSKRKKLEEMNSFNIFSSMGKKIADGISSATEKAVNKITR